jgi:hypothetical protein
LAFEAAKRTGEEPEIRPEKTTVPLARSVKMTSHSTPQFNQGGIHGREADPDAGG